MNPVAELRKYLAGFSARCRSSGWFGALFHVGVVAKIAEDVEANERKSARLTYAAEQEDHEAAAIVRRVLADNRVSPAEVPELRKALRLVNASAAHDRAAVESLTA